MTIAWLHSLGLPTSLVSNFPSKACLLTIRAIQFILLKVEPVKVQFQFQFPNLLQQEIFLPMSNSKKNCVVVRCKLGHPIWVILTHFTILPIL